MKKIIIIIIIIVFGVRPADAQIPQPDPDTTALHFLVIASIGNLQEVNSGYLAIQKSRDTDIQSFGQMLVKDHKEAEEQLLQLAKSRAYHLPKAATDGIQPDLNLENAGNNFDRLFIHAMVAGHNNKVQIFKAYATNGKDPEVKAFAKQMLPTLKAHMLEAKKIDRKLNQLDAHEK